MAKTGVEFTLTDQEKSLCTEYVKVAGYNKTALADLLGVARTTFYTLLERDAQFCTDLKSAKSEFRSNLVKRAKPEFLLERMFRKEFYLAGAVEKEILSRLDELEKKATITTEIRNGNDIPVNTFNSVSENHD